MLGFPCIRHCGGLPKIVRQLEKAGSGKRYVYILILALQLKVLLIYLSLVLTRTIQRHT
jgi:hypothetical protein